MYEFLLSFFHGSRYNSHVLSFMDECIHQEELNMKKSSLIIVFFVSVVIVSVITGCSEKTESPEDSLQKAIETAEANKTPENYLALSLMFYQAGEFEQCIEAAEKAIALRPDFAPAYNNICAAYNELRMWDQGVQACSRALEIDPEFQLARNNLEWARKSKAGGK